MSAGLRGDLDQRILTSRTTIRTTIRRPTRLIPIYLIPVCTPAMITARTQDSRPAATRLILGDTVLIAARAKSTAARMRKISTIIVMDLSYPLSTKLNPCRESNPSPLFCRERLGATYHGQSECSRIRTYKPKRGVYSALVSPVTTYTHCYHGCLAGLAPF